MLNEPLIMLALVLALLTLAFVLGKRPSPRHAQVRWQLDSQLIRHCLDLLESTQKHRGLGEACRAQEYLARLRGLAVRAAYHGRCPSGLRMQLEFLCTHLHAEADEPELPALIGRLREQLIDSPNVRITPSECFALLTPLIERRLQNIRQKWL